MQFAAASTNASSDDAGSGAADAFAAFDRRHLRPLHTALPLALLGRPRPGCGGIVLEAPAPSLRVRAVRVHACMRMRAYAYV